MNHMKYPSKWSVTAIFLSALVFVAVPVWAEQELAKQSQNPIGSVINVPFENNGYFGGGPSDASAYVLNVKPVYPITIGEVNLISRLVLPVIWLEGQDQDSLGGDGLGLGESMEVFPGTGSEFGLGDTTYQGFFSPAKPGKVIWGIGPALVMPTATSNRLGSDKWSAGPAAVALAMPGKWVVGALAQNVWSFAGDSDARDVNKFIFQYFINYNLEKGWYLTTTPILSANWEASSGNEWTVPIGGGFGRLVKFGKQAVDFKLQGFWNAVKPDLGPDWSLQFTVKFLFPK